MKDIIINEFNIDREENMTYIADRYNDKRSIPGFRMDSKTYTKEVMAIMVSEEGQSKFAELVNSFHTPRTNSQAFSDVLEWAIDAACSRNINRGEFNQACDDARRQSIRNQMAAL